MKSALVLAAAVALCGSAFAQQYSSPGVVNSAKQEAHQIASSAKRDAHRIAHGNMAPQKHASAHHHHARSSTHSMGAGPAYGMSSSREARMDAAYADWQRSQHR